MKNSSKKIRLESRSGKKDIKAEHHRGLLIRHESLPGISEWSAEQELSRVCPGPDDWLVTGRIVGSDGTGLPDLLVSVFDKDLLFDDRLGEAVTDENGDFFIYGGVCPFRCLWMEFLCILFCSIKTNMMKNAINYD